MDSFQEISRIILIGIGATAVMDIWLACIKRLGIPTLNFSLLGRWTGHLVRGQVVHVAISKADPIPGELAWGWFAHYAVGIAFAAVFAALRGMEWTLNPTLLPAILFGVITVLVPLFVMQPAMGAGFASSKTPTPMKNCARSLVGHAVFGLGLYLSAALVAAIARTL